MFKSDAVIDCSAELVVAKAIECYLIDLASRKEDASMFWRSEFEDALNVYAQAWAMAKGYKKPEWYEAENTLDAARLDDVEKDLGFIARHLCVTLPSVKRAQEEARDNGYNLPSSKQDDDEAEDDGFRW